jgi:site-specific DNA-methyltransferase (adenine-specific)
VTTKHLMMLGDCLDRMREIPDESVGLVLTDPPYGMSYQSNRRVATERFQKIANDDSLDWLDVFLEETHRTMRPDTAAFIFCSWHHIDTFKARVARQFTIKNLLVWVKNVHGSGDLTGAYAPKHEFVIFAHKGRCLLRDGRRPDILEFPKVSGSKMVHPTEKPVPLCERLILDASDADDVVLDPFAGSGTTGVACANTGRMFIGIERDEGYFQIAEERIRTAYVSHMSLDEGVFG